MLKYTLLPLLAIALSGCIVVDSSDLQGEQGRYTTPSNPFPQQIRIANSPLDNHGYGGSYSDNTVTIRTYDGRCVDVSGYNNHDVLAYPCHGQDNQQFIFEDNQIITADGLCLDVAGANSAQGTPVIAYACNGGLNQQWRRDGRKIRSVQTGQCMDIDDGIIKMYSCSHNRGQDFLLRDHID